MAKKSVIKRGHKSSKSRRKQSFLVQGVGVFSSIPYTRTPLETAFKNGLGSIATALVKESLGYDPSDLRNGLSELNKHPGVGLIVTVGGLVTHLQAADAASGATNYFISLIGGRNGVQGAGTGYFLGGVCLQSYSRNPLRIDKLKRQFSIGSDDELCLLSNPRSSMAAVEKRGWINNRIVDASIDPTTVDPAVEYRRAFADITSMQDPRIRAVVVSADPYFFTTGRALVQEANNWINGASPGQTRVVCYPLQDYSLYNPTGNRRVLHGPSLRKAYTELGKKARKILTAASSPSGTLDDALEEIN